MMDFDEPLSFSFLLRTLLPRLPAFIVCVVGMSLAMTRWSRYPRAAALAFFGCGLSLLTLVGTVIWFTLLPIYLEMPFGIGWLYSAGTFCFGLMDAAGFGLVVMAAFAERSGGPPRPWPRHEPGPVPVQAPRPERPAPGPDRPDAYRE